MTGEELRAKLFQQMTAAQAKYRAWLLTQPPNVILDHACAYTVRQDIVMEMSALELSALELSEAHVKALLKSHNPLADIYKEWNKAETHHMDDVREVIEARADAVIRAEKETGQREGR